MQVRCLIFCIAWGHKDNRTKGQDIWRAVIQAFFLGGLENNSPLVFHTLPQTLYLTLTLTWTLTSVDVSVLLTGPSWFADMCHHVRACVHESAVHQDWFSKCNTFIYIREIRRFFFSQLIRHQMYYWNYYYYYYYIEFWANFRLSQHERRDG